MLMSPTGSRFSARMFRWDMDDLEGYARSEVATGNCEHQLFGSLTTDANAEVAAIHPKAMPVILRTDDEIETWMTAPAEEALKLQRPLSNGALKVVMTQQRNWPAPHIPVAKLVPAPIKALV